MVKAILKKSLHEFPTRSNISERVFLSYGSKHIHPNYLLYAHCVQIITSSEIFLTIKATIIKSYESGSSEKLLQ